MNCLVHFFENRLYEVGYPDPDDVARRVVAQFRSEMTNHPGDPGYAEIVERLWPDLTVVMHTPMADTDTKRRLEALVAEYEHRHGLRIAA